MKFKIKGYEYKDSKKFQFAVLNLLQRGVGSSGFKRKELSYVFAHGVLNDFYKLQY